MFLNILVGLIVVGIFGVSAFFIVRRARRKALYRLLSQNLYLIKINELSWKRLMTLHNVYFINNLLKEARTAIKEDNFKSFKNNFLKDYNVKKTSLQ